MIWFQQPWPVVVTLVAIFVTTLVYKITQVLLDLGSPNFHRFWVMNKQPWPTFQWLWPSFVSIPAILILHMKAGPTLVFLLAVLKLHMMAEGYLGVSRYFYKLRRVIRIFHIHSAPTFQSKFLTPVQNIEGWHELWKILYFSCWNTRSCIYQVLKCVYI